jgi:hypothetical protein
MIFYFIYSTVHYNYISVHLQLVVEHIHIQVDLLMNNLSSLRSLAAARVTSTNSSSPRSTIAVELKQLKLSGILLV